jgi:hypothetical protein
LRTGTDLGLAVYQGVDGALRSEKVLCEDTHPREVDAMRARRFSTVAIFLGASALVLIVLAFASCGTRETKSVDGGVSVERAPAGVASPAGSEPDLAQSSEGAVGIQQLA